MRSIQHSRQTAQRGIPLSVYICFFSGSISSFHAGNATLCFIQSPTTLLNHIIPNFTPISPSFVGVSGSLPDLWVHKVNASLSTLILAPNWPRSLTVWFLLPYEPTASSIQWALSLTFPLSGEIPKGFQYPLGLGLLSGSAWTRQIPITLRLYRFFVSLVRIQHVLCRNVGIN